MHCLLNTSHVKTTVKFHVPSLANFCCKKKSTDNNTIGHILNFSCEDCQPHCSAGNNTQLLIKFVLRQVSSDLIRFAASCSDLKKWVALGKRGHT